MITYICGSLITYKQLPDEFMFVFEYAFAFIIV